MKPLTAILCWSLLAGLCLAGGFAFWMFGEIAGFRGHEFVMVYGATLAGTALFGAILYARNRWKGPIVPLS